MSANKTVEAVLIVTKKLAKWFLMLLSITSILFSNVNAEAKEKTITTCNVVKEAYLHINTDFLPEKNQQSSFKIEEQPSGETYILSKLISLDEEEDQILFLKNRYYNISYKSAKTSFINWNLLDLIREGKIKAEVLNESSPLVIRSYEPRVDEHVYFFNLDPKGNGTMSAVRTRWYSFMNLANNQSLMYAICRNTK